MEKIKEIMTLIVMVSAYWREKLEDHVVEMYAEDLSEFSIQELKEALNQMRRNPKVKRFPMPSEIAQAIRPSIHPEDEAREASARIIAAVSKFGWARPEDAREYIGELGWAVVNRQGGWSSLCEGMRSSMIPSLQAQFRDLAISVKRRHLAGVGDMPPSLPQRESTKIEARKTLEKDRQRDLSKIILSLSEKNKMEV